MGESCWSFLSQNIWGEGWAAYKMRLESPITIMTVPPNPKLWKGPNYNVRNVTVVHEQSLGDSFQFSRYLPSASCCKGEVIFSGPEKLHNLLRSSGLFDKCWDPESHDFNWKKHELGRRDAWIPMLSLASLMQGSAHKINKEEPYLNAEATRIEKWASTLKTQLSPVIALHWQGNPKHEYNLADGRSISLKLLKPLLKFANIQWISLQKGYGSEQIDELELRDCFHRSQSQIDSCWDFQEIAAILVNCDLVITSDSGLAHLSAGLGRPTWLMLMKVSEWRWGIEGNNTAWYPCMRLFRQRQRNNWNELIEDELVPTLRQWRASWVVQ